MSIKTIDLWKAQSVVSTTFGPSILYKTKFISDKVLGDSLTALDLFLYKHKKQQCVLHVTNLFMLANEVEIDTGDSYLLFSIPAWADPNVYLTNFMPEFDMNGYDRLILATIGTNQLDISAYTKKLLDFAVTNHRIISNSLYIGAKLHFVNQTVRPPVQVAYNSKNKKIFMKQLFNHPTFNKNLPSVTIVITRTNYVGDEPIPLSHGLLDTDHIRVYGYRPQGYEKYQHTQSKTGEMTINYNIIQDLLKEQNVVLRAFNITKAMAMEEFLPADQFKLFASYTMPRQNICYNTIIMANRTIQEICEGVTYKLPSGEYAIAADRVLIIDENNDYSKLPVKTPNSTNLEFVPISTYPFYIVSEKICLDAYPPHLRSIVIGLWDKYFKHNKTDVKRTKSIMNFYTD